MLQRDPQREITARRVTIDLSAWLSVETNVHGLEPTCLRQHLLDQPAFAGSHLIDRTTNAFAQLHRVIGFTGRSREKRIDSDLNTNGFLAPITLPAAPFF